MQEQSRSIESVTTAESEISYGGKKEFTVKQLDGTRYMTCFISASTADGEFYATRLSRHLKAYDVRTLNPDVESAGTYFIAGLQDLMTRADFLIVVGTRKALAPQWVLAEVEYFRSQRRPIFAISFRGVADAFPDIPLSICDLVWLREKSLLCRRDQANSLWGTWKN